MKVTVISWNFPHRTRHFAWGEVQAIRESGALSRLISSNFVVYDPQLRPIYKYGLLFRVLFKLSKLVRNLAFRDVSNRYLKEMLFDWFAAFHLDRPDLVYIDKNNFCRTIKTAQSRGIRVVVFQQMPHNDYIREVLEEDKRLFSINHGSNEDIRLSRRRLKGLLIADRIIAHSKVVVNSDHAMGVSTDNICLAYGSVDNDLYSPAPESRNQDFTVLFVGQGWLLKGLIYLLKAWSTLTHLNARLVIAGEVPKRLIDEYQDNTRTTFLGSISEELVRGWYRKASMLVLPSLIDAGPKAVLEAMSSGLPVLVTESMGYSEIITDGKEGFIVAPRDSKAIAAGIELLYQDREKLEAMSNAARSTAESFSPQVHGATVLAHLKALNAENR